MPAENKLKSGANKDNFDYLNFAVEILFLVFIFLMPVIFDRRVGIVFSLTKTTLMRIMAVLILSVWSIRLLLSGKAKFISSPLDWPVLTYLLSCTVAMISSVHVFTSLVGFYGRYEGLLTLYNYGLCLFVVTNYIRSPRQIVRIIAVIMCAVSAMSIYGIMQRLNVDPYAWGGVVTNERVIGTIGQPNFFAAYLDMAFMLILILYFKLKEFNWNIFKGKEAANNWFEQLTIVGYFLITQCIFIVMLRTLDLPDVILWYVGFAVLTVSAVLFAFSFEKLVSIIAECLAAFSLALIYIALLFTQSRGGYIAFVFGGTLFLLLIGRKILFKNWVKVIALGAVLIVITSAASLSPLSRFLGEVSIKSSGSKSGMEVKQKYNIELSGAAGSRVETWKSAIAIIADYPLFGIGEEVLKMVFPRYETDLFRYKEAFHVKQDRCHNSIFDVNVTRGMISFAFYLWFLYTVFSLGIKKIRNISDEDRLALACVLAAISTYIVQNQFSFGIVAIGSLFWINMGLVAVIGRKNEDTENVKLTLENFPFLWGAVIIVLDVILIYLSIVPFMGDLYYKNGKTLSDMRSFPASLQEFQKSIDWYPYEGMVYTQMGISALNAAQMSGGSGQALAQAEDVFLRGMQLDPYNADNYYIMSKVQRMKSMQDQRFIPLAENYAQIALKIDPYYAEAYENLGFIYEERGDLQKALQYFEKAASINASLGASMGKVMEINQKLGTPQKTLDFLKENYAKYPWEINFLGPQAEILSKMGRVKEAEDLFLQVLANDPNSSRAKIKLADIYTNTGRSEDALKLLLEVTYAEPGNVDAHIGLGDTYLKMGRKNDARSEFEQVLQLAPDNAYARQMLGRVR